MNAIIDNARAFLRSFERSDYQDILVRQGDFEMFIARQNGGVNRLPQAVGGTVAAPAPAAVGPTAEAYVISAPHLGTFQSSPATGSDVEAGGVIAMLTLLDESIELRADRAGTITEVTAQPGELVEYGTPLLTLSAATPNPTA